MKIKLVKMDGEDYASLFLRLGLAFSFLYVAVSIFLNPVSWIGFVPKFAEIFLPVGKLIYVHAIFDAFLGIWLLTNKKIFHAAVLSAANLFLITMLNLGAMEIVFRDVTILFSAVALAVLTKGSK